MLSGIIVLFVTAFAVYFYSRRRSRLPLPPGPHPKFFTGNASTTQAGVLADVRHLGGKLWCIISSSLLSGTLANLLLVGPILSFRVPGQQFIVLNVWMHTELAKRMLTAVSISFNHAYFKTYRRCFRASLSPRNIQRYSRLQIEESRETRRAVVLNLAYGWKVTKNDAYLIGILQESICHVCLYCPGLAVWLVEVIPSCAGFKRVAFDLGKKLSRTDTIPFDWTKQQIKSDNYAPSSSQKQLLREDGSTVGAEQEEIIKWCMHRGSMPGEQDTTVAAATSFVLAMMLYPEVQKHAQAEIDAVVGQDRFPTFEDREKLPYIRALIQEILRWAPTSTKGTEFPKGAIVIANIFSMSRDKETYPDPLEFQARTLPSVPSPQLDPHKFVFGFGRRACPGIHFAEASLYLNISCTLAAFTIAKTAR
ncbi:cytochrome P450 [Suillus paluster]|uniref:cytochrome P450 n=1 Tax=Suillus paluster TaxID=48578 RepID=UPI001B874E98|nr:cytochrome P450 [Suillus paluster]KAG1719823.1 cytochrome P450 [Suillus paluster]